MTKLITVSALAVIALAVASTGCVIVEQVDYHHENPESYSGPVDQHVEATVEEANVDADTQIDADTQVEAEGTIEAGGGDAADDDAGVEGEGTTTASGDGVSFEYVYQGPLDEAVELRPQLGVDNVASIEWLIGAVVFDEPTMFDDEAGFDWGEPQYDDGSYALAHRFDADASAPLVWDTTSTWCDDAGCHGRAVSAACQADIVMRVWLADGTALDARLPHESARPTCW